MTVNRNLRMAGLLALGLVAASLLALPASAQSAMGTFSLPIETRWGRAVLPPGDYSFTLNSAGMPGIITIHGEKTVAIVTAAHYDIRTRSNQSSLTLVRRGRTGTVRSLQVGDLGMTFYYTGPEAEPPVLAKGPELIQKVPVAMVGK